MLNLHALVGETLMMCPRCLMEGGNHLAECMCVCGHYYYRHLTKGGEECWKNGVRCVANCSLASYKPKPRH